MNAKQQKIVSAGFISLVAVGGLEVLVDILNLNQPEIYLQVAFWIFLYLMFEIAFLFDLHIKQPGSLARARQRHAALPASLRRQAKVYWSAFAERFNHLCRWNYLRRWLHFLLLPAFIFWSTIGLLYVNLGNLQIEQLLALLSSLALIIDYWFLKESFSRAAETADPDIFVALSMVKIYAVALFYAAALALLRYYCLSPYYFSLAVFAYTFLIIWQALYLHRRTDGQSMTLAILMSVIMGLAAQIIYVVWGYNYFTAAVFMAAIYNLMWANLHYHIDRALTWRAFWEILIISAIICAMLFGVTNFKARILGGCEYYL